jgi:hypothetical protein
VFFVFALFSYRLVVCVFYIVACVKRCAGVDRPLLGTGVIQP